MLCPKAAIPEVLEKTMCQSVGWNEVGSKLTSGFFSQKYGALRFLVLSTAGRCPLPVSDDGEAHVRHPEDAEAVLPAEAEDLLRFSWKLH